MNYSEMRRSTGGRPVRVTQPRALPRSWLFFGSYIAGGRSPLACEY